MSHNEIVEKLVAFLGRHAPMTEECHIVYFLVEIRKVIEHEEAAGGYPFLKFYADWAVHTEKDRVSEPVKAVIRSLAGGATRESGRVTISELHAGTIQAFAHMADLRTETATFLSAHGISVELATSDDYWNAFVGLLVRVLENQPIRPRTPIDGIVSISFERAAEPSLAIEIALGDPSARQT